MISPTSIAPARLTPAQRRARNRVYAVRAYWKRRMAGIRPGTLGLPAIRSARPGYDPCLALLAAVIGQARRCLEGRSCFGCRWNGRGHGCEAGEREAAVAFFEDDHGLFAAACAARGIDLCEAREEVLGPPPAPPDPDACSECGRRYRLGYMRVCAPCEWRRGRRERLGRGELCLKISPGGES